jgi:hypothetical protein
MSTPPPNQAMQRTARPDAMTVIEIRPHAWGWKVFEAPGVEPVFPEKRQAIDYAETRACFRSGEIRVLDVESKIQAGIVNARIKSFFFATKKRVDQCPLEKNGLPSGGNS